MEKISERSKDRKKGNLFTDWIIPIIIAAILAVLVNKFLLFKVYIPSESMVPTIQKGDQIFVTRIFNFDKIESGDILVFDSEELNDKIIKRVIGLPGDHIIIKDGVVFRNGERLVEDYIGAPDEFDGEYTVPDDSYFFLGDNRANSKDSRYFINAYINEDSILGKAQVRVYPFEDFGWVNK